MLFAIFIPHGWFTPRQLRWICHTFDECLASIQLLVLLFPIIIYSWIRVAPKLWSPSLIDVLQQVCQHSYFKLAGTAHNGLQAVMQHNTNKMIWYMDTSKLQQSVYTVIHDLIRNDIIIPNHDPTMLEIVYRYLDEHGIITTPFQDFSVLVMNAVYIITMDGDVITVRMANSWQKDIFKVSLSEPNSLEQVYATLSAICNSEA